MPPRKAVRSSCIGCNEMDPRPEVHTIYNSLLFIDNHGQVLGRHRKLMPTFVERAVWGCGDGTDLQCLRHRLRPHRRPDLRREPDDAGACALIAQGEDFHVAVFPGAFALHTGPQARGVRRQGGELLGLLRVAARTPSRPARSCSALCGYITEDDFPADFALRDNAEHRLRARAAAPSIAPIGIPLAPPDAGRRHRLCRAARRSSIKVAKAVVDTMGHYARPDVFSAVVSRAGAPAAFAARPSGRSSRLPRGELLRIADRHEVQAGERRGRGRRRRLSWAARSPRPTRRPRSQRNEVRREKPATASCRHCTRVRSGPSGTSPRRVVMPTWRCPRGTDSPCSGRS